MSPGPLRSQVVRTRKLNTRFHVNLFSARHSSFLPAVGRTHRTVLIHRFMIAEFISHQATKEELNAVFCVTGYLY